MNQNKLYSKITDLADWLEKVNLFSYDPFDLQSSKLAIKIPNYIPSLKLKYYFTGGLFYAGVVFPKASRWFIKKTRAAHSSAMFVSACSMMHEATDSKIWQIRSDKELNWLLLNKCTGYHGLCWGLPFTWQMGGSDSVTANANTPYSTVTPYGTEALIRSGRPDLISSTSDFFRNDLKITYQDDNHIGLSYSPLDSFRVINVNAYAAWNLSMSEGKDTPFAHNLVNHVISQQNEDGSWDYWAKDDKNTSGMNKCDCLHQVYIMRCLSEYNKVARRDDVLYSIGLGGEFMSEFFHPDTWLYTKFPHDDSLIELIDNAEAVSLGVCELDDTIKAFAIEGKSYYSPMIRKGKKFTLPYIRWGNIQLFYAMCKSYLEG